MLVKILLKKNDGLMTKRLLTYLLYHKNILHLHTLIVNNFNTERNRKCFEPVSVEEQREINTIFNKCIKNVKQN